MVVTGDLTNWDVDRPHAQTAGGVHQSPAGCQEHVFVDGMSAKQAYQRFTEILSGAAQPAAHWGRRIPLTDGELFAWKRFLQARPEGRRLLDNEIVSVLAYYWFGHPCLEIAWSGTDDLVWITLDGRHAKFHK